MFLSSGFLPKHSKCVRHPLVRINMSKFITFSLPSKDTHESAEEPKILFFSFVGFDVNTTGALYVVMWWRFSNFTQPNRPVSKSLQMATLSLIQNATNKPMQTTMDKKLQERCGNGCKQWQWALMMVMISTMTSFACKPALLSQDLPVGKHGITKQVYNQKISAL